MTPFSTVSSRTGAIIAAGGALLLSTLSPLLAADSGKGSAGPNQAKNLARLNCGAHIERVQSGGHILGTAATGDASDDPAALLLDDYTLSCALPTGDSTFVITLPKIADLQRFSFMNQNGAGQGDFDLAVSNYRLGINDPKWVTVQTALRFGGSRLINLPLLGVEAKYVKLAFHMHRAGRLAGVALYGSRTLESFAERNVLRARTSFEFGAMKLVTHRQDTLNFSIINRYAEGHVTYVSSGAPTVADRMIDDDATTSFSFAPDDAHPTVVIALAHRQNIHRVSVIYQMQEGQLDVYLLNAPGNPPGSLAGAAPIASITSKGPDGRAAVDFDPHGAQYIALRWSPVKAGTPIEVAEIAAFGTVPLSFLDLEDVPNSLADISKPGEGTWDFSNKLGTLAEPPNLAILSP